MTARAVTAAARRAAAWATRRRSWSACCASSRSSARSRRSACRWMRTPWASRATARSALRSRPLRAQATPTIGSGSSRTWTGRSWVRASLGRILTAGTSASWTSATVRGAPFAWASWPTTTAARATRARTRRSGPAAVPASSGAPHSATGTPRRYPTTTGPTPSTRPSPSSGSSASARPSNSSPRTSDSPWLSAPSATTSATWASTTPSSWRPRTSWLCATMTCRRSRACTAHGSSSSPASPPPRSLQASRAASTSRCAAFASRPCSTQTTSATSRWSRRPRPSTR
mmetsp:Transcript_3086/g.10280  ORF Transcript_3086/g.10280 Transcript_3086/m.10280 type:complete len:286 (+) Transcript_3086:574-1431(+)